MRACLLEGPSQASGRPGIDPNPFGRLGKLIASCVDVIQTGPHCIACQTIRNILSASIYLTFT
jgi:hypothetical protein